MIAPATAAMALRTIPGKPISAPSIRAPQTAWHEGSEVQASCPHHTSWLLSTRRPFVVHINALTIR
jgi:hypothetical protein